jgi:hypothetical protein
MARKRSMFETSHPESELAVGFAIPPRREVALNAGRIPNPA